VGEQEFVAFTASASKRLPDQIPDFFQNDSGSKQPVESLNFLKEQQDLGSQVISFEQYKFEDDEDALFTKPKSTVSSLQS
jgi:hypothetical protein